MQNEKKLNIFNVDSLRIYLVFISNLNLTIDLLHLYIILNKWNNIGVILSSAKISASNPINFKHMKKSQKKTKVKLDCLINQRVWCTF